ncbi:ImmA/IrrE family metallo-endopeptidase [Fructobacillus sp. CRL 2054]|uniref:ImmA/IrrE family metallo-endopeptidase n=1 Tax=Fructobacillus sp. CRL 2054 TaxID=2763007 RepID=UPI00237981A1|nr:ImmA/IrrE family metallo-endopeptidase [Fructobacillus sp. CRL 2054]MDD9139173.1 ImmA/IrrE family metallo-endopeptidase [Fructobacillus sp. CRL 2054]
MEKTYEIEDVIQALNNLAWENDITILDIFDLDPTTSDTSIVIMRSVFMNRNYNRVAYPFRLAHEISHILYGDPSAQSVYHFSEFGKRGEELQAHKHAISLLMKIKKPASPLSFMECYKVPAWLDGYVSETFKQLA